MKHELTGLFDCEQADALTNINDRICSQYKLLQALLQDEPLVTPVTLIVDPQFVIHFEYPKNWQSEKPTIPAFQQCQA